MKKLNFVNSKINGLCASLILTLMLINVAANSQSFTYTEGNTTPPSVLNNDLLQTFGSITASSGNFTPVFGEPTAGVSALTDGAAANGTINKVAIRSIASLTYSLDLTTNYNGYQIDQISITTGWGDNGRDDPNVKVFYSLASNPSNFIELATANYNPGTSGSDVWTMSTYTASGGTLTGVASIRFDFLNQENGYVGYSEIDAAGSAVATLAPFLVSGSSSVISITPPVDMTIILPSNITASPTTLSTASGTSLVTFTAAAFTGNEPVSGTITLSGNSFFKTIAYTYDIQFSANPAILSFPGNGGMQLATVTSNIPLNLTDNGGLTVSPTIIQAGTTVLTITAPVNYRFNIKTGLITFSLGSLTRQIAYVVDKTTEGFTSDILIYEPFDYSAGAIDLTALNGGIGLSSNWTLGNNGSGNGQSNKFRIKNTPLFGYNGLSSFGNYITGGSFGNNGLNTGRPVDLTYGDISNYLDANNVIGKPGETIYLSFVMSKTAEWRDHENTVTLYNGTDPDDTGKRLVEFGYFSNTSTVSGGPFPIGIRSGAGNTTTGMQFNINQDATSLLVLKMEFGATLHTFTGFVNPVAGAPEPAANVGPLLYTFDSNTSGFSHIAFSLGNDQCCYGANNAQQGSGVFDELRVGKTYASVVPEPQLVSLTGLNIIGAGAITTAGGTTLLTASIIPGNAQQSLIINWKSLNNLVASVSPDGLVKAITNGVVTITAIATNPLNTSVSGIKVITVTGQSNMLYLSDLDWESATSGYSTVKKDKSVDNNPIKLGGVTYAKGLGTHSYSEIIYNLGGSIEKLTSQIGIDDEANPIGSVKFQVFGDGNLLYESPVILRTDASVFVEVSLAGINQLKLVADVALDGNDNDHADWADAKLFALIPATSVAINTVGNATTIVGNNGQTLSFSGNALPVDTKQTFTWSVITDPNVSAIIDASGVLSVSSNEAGKLTVTGSAFYPSAIKNSLVINAVPMLISATGISINGPANANISETVILSIDYTPVNVNQFGVTWASSNDVIATVSNGSVTGLASGTVTITATYGLDNALTAIKIINVNVSVLNVSLSGVNTLIKGHSATLTGIISPTNPSNPALTWSSSNPSVATVNSSGVVSAIGLGTVTITATSVSNPSVKGILIINIQPEVTVLQPGIVLYASSNAINSPQGTLQIMASITGSSSSAIYSVSDPSIADIDSLSGLLTSKSNGIVVVTGKLSDNATLTGSIVITVTGQLTEIKTLVNQGIAIYPNPASKVLNIKVEGGIQIKSICLVNLYGTEVYTQAGIAAITVENLSKGIYYLKAVSDTGIIIKKIIVE